MESLIIWGLSVAVGCYLGYLNGYSKKKGEDRAAREAFEAVLAETKVTAQATKQIETMFSDASWNRQRQWELRRDALMEAVRSLGQFDAALFELSSAFAVRRQSLDDGSGGYAEAVISALDAWEKAQKQFENARILAKLVSGRQIEDSMNDMGKQYRELYPLVKESNFSDMPLRVIALDISLQRCLNAFRQELGIEHTPSHQSTTLSEGLIPD